MNAALFLACIAASAPAQDPPPAASPEHRALVSLEEHLRCVASERTSSFLDLYAAASEAERAAVRRELERRRPPGSAANAPPSLELLVECSRKLRNDRPVHAEPSAAERARDELQWLADALDLKPAPGCFAARAEHAGGEARRDGSEGERRGEAITVAVHTLYAVRDARPFEITLWWLSPRGEELRARTEPVESGALSGGFPLFVRPPASEPATWRLVAELAREGVTVRGVPVAVECVRDLGGRLANAIAHPREGDTARALQHALRSLAGYGTRTSVALRPSQMLDALESNEPALEHELPLPLARAFTDRDGIEHWIWGLGASEPERTVAILVPAHEVPDALFAGALGAQWTRFARERRALVCAVPLPAALPEDADPSSATRAVLEGLRRRFGALDLTLVARGETFARLHAMLPAEREPPFDALLASTVVASSPEPFFRGRPRLVLAPGGAGDLPEADDADELPQFLWLEGSPLPLLDEPRLPEVLAKWLALRTPALR